MSYLFYLFAASLLTSKSALSALSYICVFVSVIYFVRNYITLSFVEKRTAFLFVGIYLFAILSNLFSLGGLTSAITVATIWIWPLFVFVAIYLLRHFNVFVKSLYVTSVGLLVACIYAFWNFYFFWQSPNWQGFNADARIPSFWDVSRWSFFLVLSLIILVAFLRSSGFTKFKVPQKVYFYLLTLVAAISLFLTGSRGPWVAAVMGILILLAIEARSFKKVLWPIVIVTVGYLALVFLSSGFKERLSSIIDIRIENGIITSSNISNAGRLHMWKVGLDYLATYPFQPTGFENTEDAYRLFLSSKSEEYIKTHVVSEFSYRDQHSSYLSPMVQFGILFSVILYSIIFYTLFAGARALYKERKDLFFVCCWVLLLTQLSMYSFYSSILSYEAMILFLVVGVMKLKPETKANHTLRS